MSAKVLFSRREALEDTYGLQEKVERARRGARRVRLLLASRGCELAVRPVLVLAGPGAPAVGGVVEVEGVLVAAFRDSDAWRQAMAGPGHALDLETAGRAAQVLLAYAGQRRVPSPRQRQRGPGEAPRAGRINRVRP